MFMRWIKNRIEAELAGIKSWNNQLEADDDLHDSERCTKILSSARRQCRNMTRSGTLLCWQHD